MSWLVAPGGACEAVYGNAVFARGLIEFTNICKKNDCYYCGIRRSNRACERYRLTREQILACADAGWQAGFRTFVLQGGEDPAITDEWLGSVVATWKTAYPGCAVTLSVGNARRRATGTCAPPGPTGYLLRHETATAAHYRRLHPAGMTLSAAWRACPTCERLASAVGAGFMVGPFQTTEMLAADLAFIQSSAPKCAVSAVCASPRHAVCAEAPGTVELYLALAVPHSSGASDGAAAGYDGFGSAGSPRPREGHLAGANVVMPNLSPPERQGDYALYDGKPRSSYNAARKWADLAARLEPSGRRLVEDRGDPLQPRASMGPPASVAALGPIVPAAASRPVSSASSADSFPSTFPIPSTKVNLHEQLQRGARPAPMSSSTTRKLSTLWPTPRRTRTMRPWPVPS